MKNRNVDTERPEPTMEKGFPIGYVDMMSTSFLLQPKGIFEFLFSWSHTI